MHAGVQREPGPVGAGQGLLGQARVLHGPFCTEGYWVSHSLPGACSPHTILSLHGKRMGPQPLPEAEPQKAGSQWSCPASACL